MQLNVYIPKERADLVQRLSDTAKRLGRQKNEIVLAALEAYLGGKLPELGSYALGHFEMPSREELYGEHLDQKYSGG